jgi:hypothetical protein
MFHLKLLINFSLLVNCRVKLTGTPSVMTIESGTPLKSGESSGSAPRGFSRLVVCRQLPVTLFCRRQRGNCMVRTFEDKKPTLLEISTSMMKILMTNLKPSLKIAFYDEHFGFVIDYRWRSLNPLIYDEIRYHHKKRHRTTQGFVTDHRATVPTCLWWSYSELWRAGLRHWTNHWYVSNNIRSVTTALCHRSPHGTFSIRRVLVGPDDSPCDVLFHF